jgi:hypothetical protein
VIFLEMEVLKEAEQIARMEREIVVVEVEAFPIL